MTDDTQPEAGSTHIIRFALELGLLWIDGSGRDHVREALDALDILESQLEAIGAGGVSGPLMGQPQAMPDLSALTERGAKAWAGVDAQALRDGTYQQAAPKAAPGEPFDECFPGEPRVAVPQGLIGAACFAIRNKRDGGKVLEQLRRYSVGDLSQPLAPQQEVQEPYAYAVYFPDQPTVELVHDLDELTDDLTNREHQITKLYTAPQPAPAPLSDDVVRDAAFDAVRKKLCALPRFSFLSDGYGVRRVPDKSGSWIAFDAAHALFDPVAVDAALAAQGGK